MKTIFSCLLILTNLAAFSQTLTADFSDAKNANYNTYKDGVKAKNGRILLKENIQSFGGLINIIVDKKATLLLVNDKMETLKETEVVFKNKRFINLKGLYQLNGKTILVYSYKNEKKETEYAIDAIKINESDNSMGQEVELGRFQTTSGNEMPYFEFSVLPDSSKYLLFVEADQSKKEMKQFYFGTFNSDLTKLYDKTTEMSIENRYVIIESKVIDKRGNMFVEYKHFDKEIKNKEATRDEDHGTPSYSTVLTQYSLDGKGGGEIALGLGDKFLHSSQILLNDKTGKIGIAGTYRDEEKGRISGVFYCEYDPSAKTVTKMTKSDIPADILELFDKEDIAKSGKKNAGISGNFRAKRLSLRSNGTIDYTLEFNQMMLISLAKVGANGMMSSVSNDYFQYYSHSILNVNIDNNGKMIFTRIPKNQSGVRNSYLSNFSFYNGNKLIFLYNDDKDNVDRDLNKVPSGIDTEKRKSLMKSVLMAAIVDEKGNLERKIVYEHEDDNYITLIYRLKEINPDMIFSVRLKIAALTEDITHLKYGVITVKP